MMPYLESKNIKLVALFRILNLHLLFPATMNQVHSKNQVHYICKNGNFSYIFLLKLKMTLGTRQLTDLTTYSVYK